MLKKMVLLCALTSLFAGNSLAQNGQGRGRFEPRSSIAVTVDGLTCNNGQGTIPALTWSFGVSAPVSTSGSGGGGTTKATVSDLNITRKADGCTPILFADVVTGTHIKQVTIVQQDAQKDDVFTLTLQDVIIDSYQMGGDQANEMPVEQVGFSFAKICVADTGTGTKACWDMRLGRAFQ